ncbi:MAG: hypothetical protein AB7V48_14980 [Sedimentibacter sp.]
MSYENVRVIRLFEYVKGLKYKENGVELYAKYKNDIENVKPQEAFEVFKILLDEGTTPNEAVLLILERSKKK